MEQSKAQAYDEFNVQFKEFLKDIIPAYPNVIELKIMKAGYKLLKKISKKKPQRTFDYMFGSRYKEQISKRDSDFFASDDFKIEYCSNLKNVWATVDDVNKSHIWNHIALLVKKSEVCNQFREKNKNVESSDEEGSDSEEN
jgi:hypothetical protein